MKIMMLLYKKISNQENRISEKFKKLNINIELSGNFPWIYINKISIRAYPNN